jgi:hypothetical protein
MRSFSVLAVLLTLASVVPAGAQRFPNGQIQIAYHDVRNGKPSDTVHELTVACWNDECDLTTLTITGCTELLGERYAYAKIVRTSTPEHNVKVSMVHVGLLRIEEKDDDTTFTYRIGYTTFTDQEFQRRFHLRSPLLFKRVTSFVGAAVGGHLQDPKSLDTWQLVPLKGLFPQVKLDCPIQLHGLE